MSSQQLPYFDTRFAALAHRGGWIDPAANFENSLRAFTEAWDFGYRYLETDVRLTKDGELVVFHDAELDRTTNGTGALADRTWGELQEALIGGVEPLLRLSELLEALPEARFNIDIKCPEATIPLAEVIRKHRAESRVCVGSFSGRRVREFRLQLPGVATACSPLAVFGVTHAIGARRFLSDDGNALQIPRRFSGAPFPLVRRDVVEFAHARGCKVHVWTIDSEAEMHHLIDIGVDGIVTNDLSTLKQVLIERDLWEEQ